MFTFFVPHEYSPSSNTRKNPFDLFAPLRHWLDGMDIKNPFIAHLICTLIPSSCPFERDVNFFGRTLFHIPALCKLNPLYEEVVSLRFRSLRYLTDVCGEDIAKYLG